MKCRVCGKEMTVGCLCGYCEDCTNKYGHDECHELAKEKENDVRKTT